MTEAGKLLLALVGPLARALVQVGRVQLAGRTLSSYSFMLVQLERPDERLRTKLREAQVEFDTVNDQLNVDLAELNRVIAQASDALKG